MGDFTNDLVGCDVGRGLGLAFNGTADDAIYGSPPPSLADPAVQQAYSDLIGCLSSINAGIGIGETCTSGPTPALVSRASADATTKRVTLRWYAGEAGRDPWPSFPPPAHRRLTASATGAGWR